MRYQPPPQKPASLALIKMRDDAKAALRKKRPHDTSRMRQQWLAEKLGIEMRYAIIADMDETECRTVLDICQQRTQAMEK